MSDLTGTKFGNLVVLHKHPVAGHNSKWVCKCLLCNGTAIIARPNLKSGNNTDCGCQKPLKISKASLKHGDSHANGTIDHQIYKKWTQMRSRCKDKNKNYIKKGITVCPEWQDYLNFKNWAKLNGFDPNLELDRINNDAGYSPDNCRFVTHAENCNNKSHPSSIMVKNNNGELFKTTKQASLAYGLNKGAVARSLKSNGLCAGLKWERVMLSGEQSRS